MARWDLSVDLGPAGEGAPIFVRIAAALSADIARGRLSPGQRLPGTRRLAASLGVHRNTVVAAFDELSAQGWVRMDPARGTFVEGVPEARPRRPARAPLGRIAEKPGFPLRGTPPGMEIGADDPSLLHLAGGRPDARLFPADLLARAYRRALRSHGREALDYGDPRGDPGLRSAIAAMLAERRGVAASADDVLVTRGAQMALWLAGRVLFAPGDRVAVEDRGYPPAWLALRDAGAELVGAPVDAHGLVVSAVAEKARSGPLRAVYVTPHHQFPTMATLSAARRLELLALARHHGFAIIEDDYDNEYHYEGRPVLPLASMDASGSVVYVGTLSKVLAPGLRIGFAVAPRPLLERMASLRVLVDRQGDLAMERAVAELIEDGELQRHAWRMRRIYQARRDVLVASLRRHLPGVVSFVVPSGGLAVWVRVAPGLDVERWAARARERGVVFQPGRLFAFDGKKTPTARLGFARLDEGEIEEAVRRLAAAVPVARAMPLRVGVRRPAAGAPGP
jgi:GntR family transcriptional regulator/MocR family aminotransferase